MHRAAVREQGGGREREGEIKREGERDKVFLELAHVSDKCIY